jgi:N-methylhydantoinase A
MLLGGLRADVVRTHLGSLDPPALARLFTELESEARGDLDEGAAEVEVERFLELRYAGQEHTLQVPVPAGPIDDEALVRVRAEFERRSEESYAFTLPVAVEVVAGRLSVTSPSDRARWPSLEHPSGRELAPREVDLDQHGGVRTAEVFDRAALEPARPVDGPCVVEEPASTTLVLLGQRVVKDELGNLLIEEADR